MLFQGCTFSFLCWITVITRSALHKSYPLETYSFLLLCSSLPELTQACSIGKRIWNWLTEVYESDDPPAQVQSQRSDRTLEQWLERKSQVIGSLSVHKPNTHSRIPAAFICPSSFMHETIYTLFQLGWAHFKVLYPRNEDRERSPHYFLDLVRGISIHEE